MAGFDKSKDVVEWMIDIDGLQITVNRYNGGEPKLQIGPRSYTKKDGSVGFAKAGRLSKEETIQLFEHLPKILEIMEISE